VKEKQFREIASPFLSDNGVAAAMVEELLGPMGELMSTLRDVKLSKITYLELRPFDGNLWTEDEYNDAIVNIFTRLNTAGRALTKEEITFAWLKVGWDANITGNRTAGKCFASLLELTQEKGLPITMDDLVRAVSFIWSVSYRNGELLSDKDLLKGNTVRPMARDLASAWSDIVESIGTVLDIAGDRDLRYGQNGQYYSINALNVLWSWFFLSRRWLRDHPQNVTKRDSFEKSIRNCLDDYLDRWVICSHWAGRWGGSSGTVLANYAKNLHSDHQSLAATVDSDDALTIFVGHMSSLLDGLASEATTYAQTYSVGRREQVSRYSTLLWVWHRLDDTRWKMSRIPLRIGRRQKCDLEVDHSVAHSLWEDKVKMLPPKDADHEEELMEVVNGLGNCALLEKTFNISKSNRPLKTFMEEVHEIKNGDIALVDWASALGLSDCLLDPSGYSIQSIRDAIEKRDEDMRQELTDFVLGKRVRQDIKVPSSDDEDA